MQERCIYAYIPADSESLQVHISDVMNLYLLVINYALSFYPSAPPTSPYERYYIANTRHETFNVIATHFATALHKLGKIPSAEVARVTLGDANPYEM
jgi:hypothetical protein